MHVLPELQQSLDRAKALLQCKEHYLTVPTALAWSRPKGGCLFFFCTVPGIGSSLISSSPNVKEVFSKAGHHLKTVWHFPGTLV